MSSRTIQVDDRLHAYLLSVSLREPSILAELRAETAKLPVANMQISPEQGQLMALLVELTGARRILEIGTFTGYSSLVMALALPPEGRVITCDISEEYTAVARRYWARAGVSDRIELRLGPALETARALAAEAPFDMAFIDADKESYEAYYERVLEVMRPGGLVCIDNVLWAGRVADPTNRAESTEAIRRLNGKIHGDDRVTVSIVPIGDGLTLVRKR